MKINRSYKFRLYPNKEQEEQIKRNIGGCRKLWNLMLSDRIKSYQATGKTIKQYPTYYKNKKEFEYLKEADSTALNTEYRKLDEAFERFFKSRKSGNKVGFPKFKRKKSDKDSYTISCIYNNIRVIDDSHIRLAKLGSVKFKQHKQVVGKIKNATIEKSKTGKYYVSVCTEIDNYVNPRPPSNKKRIGIDIGIKDLYTDSEGNSIPNPKFYNKSLQRRRKLYKDISRKKKVKNSKNRRKAVLRLAKFEEHINNQRKDYLQKVSTKLINENQVICLETLSVTDMMKGKSKAINRNVMDTGIYYFLNCIRYKAKLYGREVYVVGKYYPSSQICHHCKNRNKSVKNLSIREWTCPVCGNNNLRDYNAALNIRDKATKRVV